MWMAVLLAFQDQPTCAPGSDWLSSVTPATAKEGQSFVATASNLCILSLCLLTFSILDAIILTTIAVAVTVHTITWAMNRCKKSRGNSTGGKLEEGDSEGASQLELMNKGTGMDNNRAARRG